MAARAVAVAAGTVDAQGVGASDGLRLMGYSVSETASSASAAEVILRHGISASAPQLVAPINLDENGFGMEWLGENGVECQDGIFIDRVSGNTTVVLYLEG